jgi:hypothetical protein
MSGIAKESGGASGESLPVNQKTVASEEADLYGMFLDKWTGGAAQTIHVARTLDSPPAGAMAEYAACLKGYRLVGPSDPSSTLHFTEALRWATATTARPRPRAVHRGRRVCGTRNCHADQGRTNSEGWRHSSRCVFQQPADPGRRRQQSEKAVRYCAQCRRRLEMLRQTVTPAASSCVGEPCSGGHVRRSLAWGHVSLIVTRHRAADTRARANKSHARRRFERRIHN